MVNKSNLKAKKRDNEPALTIYPHKIDFQNLSSNRNSSVGKQSESSKIAKNIEKIVTSVIVAEISKPTESCVIPPNIECNSDNVNLKSKNSVSEQNVGNASNAHNSKNDQVQRFLATYDATAQQIKLIAMNNVDTERNDSFMDKTVALNDVKINENKKIITQAHKTIPLFVDDKKIKPVEKSKENKTKLIEGKTDMKPVDIKSSDKELIDMIKSFDDKPTEIKTSDNNDKLIRNELISSKSIKAQSVDSNSTKSNSIESKLFGSKSIQTKSQGFEIFKDIEV